MPAEVVVIIADYAPTAVKITGLLQRLGCSNCEAQALAYEVLRDQELDYEKKRWFAFDQHELFKYQQEYVLDTFAGQTFMRGDAHFSPFESFAEYNEDFWDKQEAWVISECDNEGYGSEGYWEFKAHQGFHEWAVAMAPCIPDLRPVDNL